MTTLEAVATYLPRPRTPIADVADVLGLSPMEVTLLDRFNGLREVGWDPDATLLDLLVAATERLSALRGNEHRIRYVLHARAFAVVVPFPHNPVHELSRRFGLGHAQVFTVTQQSCATGLLAIDIAGRLLAAGGEEAALALVLAGEKAFTRDARLLPGTSVFSEGASACLVAANGSHDRLLSYASLARGDFDSADGAEVAIRFQRDYRACLSEVIESATSQAGLGLDDIALVLPHNVNLVSWRRVCTRMNLPVSRVLLDNVTIAGHVFCADAFINYQTACERGLLRPGDRYVIAAAGAGLGATFSAMVFEH